VTLMAQVSRLVFRCFQPMPKRPKGTRTNRRQEGRVVNGSTGFASARFHSAGSSNLRRRVDARRDPDRREWTNSGSRTAQFPKTHSLAARWNSAGLNPRMTGHALARGLSAWRPDSRSLHTTDLPPSVISSKAAIRLSLQNRPMEPSPGPDDVTVPVDMPASAS
jgi:hypothetical protein